ncbi:methyltransferase domain-containing protein [Microbacterium sp. NPDC089696]|uniref:methyltransferase domain-containing protein n=1 Tax=Microbacterium sp. NPDC089696 TaxID=3364199 RepID=UPI0037F70451
MRVDLSTRADGLVELMDDPGADLAMLERTYDRFRFVNAAVARPDLLLRRDVLPRARRGRVRILDVGAGGGDVSRMIARRLRRAGLDAEVTALDADDRAVRWAAANDAGAGVRYRRALAAELVAEGDRYDVVFSNHVLHHLTDAERQVMLDDTRRLVRPDGVVVHRDIARSRAAYTLFDVATGALAPTFLRGSFIRIDGLLSIRRSYTPRELRAVAPPGWTVRRALPARLELRWNEPAG